MTLSNKVIVITGASSGFGELLARRCAAAGATVVLAARSANKLNQIAQELHPARVLAVPTDVTTEADVTNLVKQTLESFGHIDVLVNNAGFGVLDRIEDASLHDLQGMIDVNLYGAVRCTQAFLPHMLARRRGQIVMMASLAGMVCTPNMGFYSTTKHAMLGLSRTLAIELTGRGVKVCTICPGVAQTGFQQMAHPEKFARSTRLSRCTPEQVIDATVRAIERQTDGEIVVPGYAVLFGRLAQFFPHLARRVIALIQ